jgi:hypothetical protein
VPRPEVIAVVAPRLEDFERFRKLIDPDGRRPLLMVQQISHVEQFKIIDVVMVGKYLEVPGLRDLYNRLQKLIERN